MRFRVLIVDDEPNLLQGLRQVLHFEPYDLVTESDPQAALMRLKRQEMHVILSDYRMVGMTGTEFLTRAREILPHATRFLMTGAPTLAMAVEAINEGAVSRLFIKPFPAIVMAKAIREALERIEMAHLSMRALADAQRFATVIEQLRAQQPGLVEPLLEQRTLASGATAAGDYFPQDPGEVLQHLREHYPVADGR